MSSIIAQLEHKGDTINLVGHPLGESPYNIGRNFSPPLAEEEISYAPGVEWGQTPIKTEERNVQWDFTVSVYGSTVSELKRAIRNLQQFLKKAGDEMNPMYFAWRPYAEYYFEPKIGTLGKYARYEVVRGVLSAGANYNLMAVNNHYTEVTISLTVKTPPMFRILCGTATGSVVEDIYGAPNGKSRGVRINPEFSSTGSLNKNMIKNPIFDNPQDWDTGWTAGGDLYFDQNTDPRYVLFGGSSARVVYDGAGTGGTADALLISCATSALSLTMTISCFVKKVDSAAIQTSDFFFVRGSTSIIGMNSPIYVGDGWYWCSVTTTSNGTSNYGIRLQTAGRYLYIDGFQLEYNAYPSFLAYGDQIGSVWDGDPQNSISTRNTGTVKWPRKIVLPSYSEGTVRLVWKPDYPGKYISSGSLFYLYSDNVIDISYDGTNNRFAASDGSNTVDSGTTLLAQDTTYVIHLTFDANDGLALYVDGVVVDTNATYTLPAVASAGTLIYLGSNTSSASHAEGTFYGFAVFDREMTAAQVAADYAQIAPFVADNMRVDDIPWAWTGDGGGVVYNQNDTSEGNFAVFGGFSGDTVIPELFLTASATLSSFGEIHLGRLSVDQRDYAQIIASGIVDAGSLNLIFHDLNTTVDAACSGGGYSGITLTTTATEISLFNALFSRQNSYFADQPVAVMGRVRDEGGAGAANLRVALTYHFGTESFVTDYENLPGLTAANYGLVEFGQAYFPPSLRYRPEGGMWDRIFATATIKRSTGSAAFRTDYICHLPNPIHIGVVDNNNTMLVIRNDNARNVYGSWTTGQAEITLADQLPFEGFPLRFEGDMLNIVPFLMGRRNAADGATITWTLTINECWLIVRNNLD